MSKASILFRGLVLTVSVATAACGWFQRDEGRARYRDADAGKALEVPPDLDSPLRRESTHVPDGSGEYVEVGERPEGAVPVDADDTQSRIKIRKPVDEAYAEVQSALEAAQLGRAGEVDHEAQRIAIIFEVTETKKRWLRKDGIRTREIERVVHVVEDPIGSRVVVEDDTGLRIDDEYAQRILSALRDRVTWE